MTPEPARRPQARLACASFGIILAGVAGLVILYSIDQRDGGQVWWIQSVERESAHWHEPALAANISSNAYSATSRVATHPASPPGPAVDPIGSQPDWLPEHQEPDGHWDSRKWGATSGSACDAASTAFAILSLTGSGQTSRRGRYKTNVKRALEWIVAHQRADGCIACDTDDVDNGLGPNVAHALCGLALSEAYGMDRTPAWGQAAQRAVEYSIHHLQGQGGPRRGGFSHGPDDPATLDATLYFVMQFKSARISGLQVPNEAFADIMVCLNSWEAPSDPDDPYTRYRFRNSLQSEVTAQATLDGVIAWTCLGEAKENLEPALTWAIHQRGLPIWTQSIWGCRSVDWTYWSFATRECFQNGGPLWKNWNNAIRTLLLERQRTTGNLRGSWDPEGVDARYGRVWSTTHAIDCLNCYCSWRLAYSPSPYLNPKAKH